MIFFFNTLLNIVDIKDELSFSYSKKINREGSGKIELANLPDPDSIYISFYDKKKYITSGLIQEYQKNDKNILLTFVTLEAVLKNYKLPKTFNNFNGMKKADIFVNLLFSFFPIIKSKKKDFTNITDNYGTTANNINGVLYAENIVFGKVKDGDFHLDFDKNYKKDNEYRYCEKGFVVFHFDLGKREGVKKSYFVDGNVSNIVKYPDRFLRFSASLGSKAFIRVKAVEKDEAIKKWTDVKNDFEKAPFIKIDKSIKDFEKNTGIILPSKKRYLAIMFVFVYDIPNWIQDFSTLEVYDEQGKKYRRTVRGFTPVLHGFEILNRLPIFPIATNTPSIIFEGNRKKTKEKNVNVIKDYEQSFNTELANLSIDGLSIYDALIKFLEVTKTNIVFELKPSNTTNNTQGDFSIYVFDDEIKDTHRDKTKTQILRLHENEVLQLNNYILKTIKKKQSLLKCLHYYGEGEGQDILHCCIYNKNEFNKTTGQYEECIYLYTPSYIKEDSNGDLQFENNKKITNLKQSTIFPEGLMFVEERVENNSIKDLYTLIQQAIKYFNELQKKEIHTFEIETQLDIKLHDNVLLLHQESNLQLKACIIEEKINIKKNKKQKTFGVGGFLFNPFDVLFQKKAIVDFIQIPQVPFNIKACAYENKLRITFDCAGSVDGFIITVNRLDGNFFSSNIEEAKTCFFTKNTEIELNSFYFDTLYSFVITSFIDKRKSNESPRFFFRLIREKTPIYILQDLTERQGQEGDVAFFLDIANRKLPETQRKLMILLGMDDKAIQKINHEKDIKDKLEKLTEEDSQIVRYYLGLLYEWHGNRWVDRRIRAPKYKPVFYFDCNKNNITNEYQKDIAEKLIIFFGLLKRFEELRQKLTSLITIYKLPRYGESATFALPSRPPSNPIYNPIIEPIYPIPNPNYPNPGYGDNRKTPTREIIELYNSLKAEYTKILEKLKNHEIYDNHNYFNNLQKTNAKIFDISGFENHLSFNLPIFECLEKEWEKQITYIINVPTVGLYTEKTDKGIFLDGAFNFFWQSTLKDGNFKWEYEKPFFKIKKLNNIKEYIEFLYNTEEKKHTLSLYVKIKDFEGLVELWNIDNYNVGYICDNMLCFGFKIWHKAKQEYEYFSFYKMTITQSINNTLRNPSYIHIMVLAKITKRYSIGFPSYITEELITQNIYINDKEIIESKYQTHSKTQYIALNKYMYKEAVEEVSFFNFKEVKRADEYYPTNEYIAYKKLPFFDICFSNILFFNYWLDYGERQFINNTKLPIKKTKIEKNNSPVIIGEPQKNSKYKGVCVDEQSIKDNKVNIAGSGYISLKENDFFLMGSNSERFKAGVLYMWKGQFLQELFPFSDFQKEYVEAYNDIIEGHKNYPNVFFKDFIINILQVSENLYTKTIQTNDMIVQKDLCLNGLKENDPKIKGVVYKYNNYLKVSEG